MKREYSYKVDQSQSKSGELIIEIINKENGKKIPYVTLNRPKALNSLTLTQVREMYPLYKQWENDDKVEMIILGSQGEKAFCAGGDIRDLYESGKDGTPGLINRQFTYEEYQLNYLIKTMRKPHVSLINGITMGGGVGLSVHGRFRVGTENSLFAMPETAIGFFPDVGGSIFLPKLGALGMYLALTGDRLKGKSVYLAGIATHYVPFANYPQLKEAFYHTNINGDNDVHSCIQKFSETASETEASWYQNKDLINEAFSKNTVEEIFTNLEKNNSEFAQKTLKTLNKVSPTSLKVTFKQIREGHRLNMDPEACLRMEYRMSQYFFTQKDFFEGVRALIVEKDNNPKWNPTHISGVTEEQVNKYFDPLPSDREWRTHPTSNL